jgi:hypothetical protein
MKSPSSGLAWTYSPPALRIFEQADIPDDGTLLHGYLDSSEYRKVIFRMQQQVVSCGTYQTALLQADAAPYNWQISNSVRLRSATFTGNSRAEL